MNVVGSECLDRIRTYLDAHGVSYEVRDHSAVYTAQQLAQVEHVPGRTVAKVVMSVAGAALVMLVLPAPEQIDLSRLASVVGKPVRLAHEEDFLGAFPDCEAGAMPPLGNLYKIPVYADASFDAASTIVFPAGSHRQTVSLKYADFERLVHPVVASFAASQSRTN
ncbi:MAG TPA: YbaK/EbsC family protein [Candidatus Limnocylindrales bacterium]|nr:YbaK/EbsC family protein [Candidatus Limnocylindrales bacterium]